jgi:hypothetical protein
MREWERGGGGVGGGGFPTLQKVRKSVQKVSSENQFRKSVQKIRGTGGMRQTN